MDRFECDYAEGAHPKIMEALMKTNFEQSPGYCTDSHCALARKLIRKACSDEEAHVYFVAGGTQANVCVISALLRSFQGCVCVESGHINVHEAGAVEATGHKVLALKGEDGKLQAETLDNYLTSFWADPTSEHMVQPGMVYISSPTEIGTVYSKSELEALYRVCQKFAIPLYLDGARMSYGLNAEGCDLTLKDIDQLTDVFYIGGTKVGALFGEAIVFTRGNGLGRNFRTVIKQHCAMTAKGRLLGVQFETLFTGGLYNEIGAHAVKAAMRIRDALKAKGCRALADSPTNQQFWYLARAYRDALLPDFAFECEGDVGQEEFLVRFCTSWATTDESVDRLIKAIEAL